jgi:hypothetical protein
MPSLSHLDPCPQDIHLGGVKSHTVVNSSSHFTVYLHRETMILGKSKDTAMDSRTSLTGRAATRPWPNDDCSLQHPEQSELQIEPSHPPPPDFQTVQKSLNFWVIIFGLGIMMWLAALENTVLTTAAPVILKEIPLREHWIWLTNAFFLASAAFQPLLGQLSDIFGRRWTTLSVIALFMIGSAICGGANNAAALIGGRAVQGAGSGGILMAYGEFE